MNLNSLLNKAKETTDKAIDKANEVKDKTIDRALDKANEVKDKAIGVKDKAAEWTGMASDYGMDKMKDAIDATLGQLLALRPVLARSGFLIGEIEVVLSIPPGLEVVITHNGKVHDSLSELEADPSLTQFQSLVIRSLRNAYALDGVFRKYNYTIGKLIIAAGIPPKVKVVLENLSHRHQLSEGHPEKLLLPSPITSETLSNDNVDSNLHSDIATME